MWIIPVPLPFLLVYLMFWLTYQAVKIAALLLLELIRILTGGQE